MASDPPWSEEVLCDISATITGTGYEEITDPSFSQPEIEPVIYVRIESISNHDQNSSISINACHAYYGRIGQQNGFRLCGNPTPKLETFIAGTTIQGIVGKSIGLGRYCIEQIEVK
ncbi:MAG: hypothetical protein KDD76_04655 [Rickettsiales bacterium]|nr:hypothetical protein [Rickettsiales bacterium]